MKRLGRFYKTVSIEPVGGMFQLLLDGKPVRTPMRNLLTFESEGVASAVASEWQIQSKFIVPNTMPMSTIITTFLDVDSQITREEKIGQISKFFQTDTIRFPASEPLLAAAQAREWAPVHRYIESKQLVLTPCAEFSVPDNTHIEVANICGKALSTYDQLGLTLLETAAKYLKSASVGLALIEGAVTPNEAWRAAYVEEIFQRENWGLVEGDHDVHDAETLLWLNGVALLAIVRPLVAR